MLFNSYEFLFGYLPSVLLIVLGVSSLGFRSAAKSLLFLASLGFYAWWSPRFIVVLIGLIVATYAIGMVLVAIPAERSRQRTAVFVAGIGLNIGTLAYFKYTNFLGALLANAGYHVGWSHVALPLGLSFIVFQKIAFLSDLHAGVVNRVSVLDYCIFVSFFPQLLAGPIVHHKEMIPQLERTESIRFSGPMMAAGLAFFVIGIGKKVLIADPLTGTVAAVFGEAASGRTIPAFSAWVGSVTYTLQLYFDFSGYCDMAVGLGLMFGILLPFNFDAPYQATNIIDFWRRWHMSLTRFLTAYLYNPIVLTRTRRRVSHGLPVVDRKRLQVGPFISLIALPTMITMSIAGVWHGAGFQFLAFGALHGAYLVVNQGWRTLRRKSAAPGGFETRWWRFLSWALTFVAVVVAFVFFRADSIRSAATLLQSMMGANGFGGPLSASAWFEAAKVALLLALVALPIVPNSVQLLNPLLAALHVGSSGQGVTYSRATRSWISLTFRPTRLWAVGLGLIAVVAVLSLTETTEFLYFNF